MDLINRDTPIPLKKYKTFGELQDAPIRSVIQCITRMKPSSEKDILSEWLFNNHYLKKKMVGNLTDRIKNFNNKICFNHLCKHYFNNFDINDCKISEILPERSVNIIKKLHSIQPSLTGTFIDYLMRRIISEIKGNQFSDNRVKSILYKNNQIIYRDNLWRFRVEYFAGFCQWNIQEEPNIKSPTIGTIQNNHTFIELSRKDEWLNIKYEGKNGWVRYKIPDCIGNPVGIEGNIQEYIDNPWLENIGKGHICSQMCKCMIESCNPWQETQCRLNYCQYECYHKVKNTGKYKIKDIIVDIFIVSLCHSECFGGCPNQEKVELILNEINNQQFYNDFIIPFHDYCKQLISNKTNIYLNPPTGCTQNNIPSDCDIILDNQLIDIKCTKGDNTISEILQLFGYSSLIHTNPYINVDIKSISIINIFKGYEYIYDISNISSNSLLDYLKLLQGIKYQEEKKKDPEEETEGPSEEEIKEEKEEDNSDDGLDVEIIDVEIITYYKKEYYIIINEKPQYIYSNDGGDLGDKVGEIKGKKKIFYNKS